MQQGVYLSFFDSVGGLFIQPYNNHSGYGYIISKGGHNGTFITDSPPYWETSPEALKEAFIQANKIYNESR